MRQGEHISIIGPTGSGKSTLAFAIFGRRKYKIGFITKPRDDTIDDYIDSANREDKPQIMRKWKNPVNGKYHYLLWPNAGRLKDIAANQQKEFRYALDDIYVDGGWTILFDELFYAVDTLGLQRELNMLYTQGRSNGITVIGCSQRPRNIPLFALNQATHLYYFRFRDKNECERLADVAGFDKRFLIAEIQKLERYQYLYINTVTGDIKKGMVTK